MKGILFHKGYDYSASNECFKNYELLLDKQQSREVKLFYFDGAKPKSKTHNLDRKLNRCFPRGRAYLKVSNSGIFNRM
ncbi:hypothetical protein PH4a_02935 [Proteus hauseri]|nr:hypothetical protein PH4a_01040 [Proteus hauseri]QAV22355.1 hypothetical protein PH4a_02935 [Proteus hauseri]